MILQDSKYRPEDGAFDVSIILLTFNRWDKTQELLHSFESFKPPSLSVELIWVENGSADDTRIMFRRWLTEHPRCFTSVRALFNDKNIGFVRGVNQGVTASHGNNVILINSDAVVAADWVERLLAPLDRYVAVGPISDGMPWDQSLRLQGHGLQEVPVLYGFCLATRKQVFNQVGLLDERYGRGVCEVEDWCERASRLGSFVVDSDLVVRHNEPHASYTPRVNALLTSRNRGLFTSKWGYGPMHWGDRSLPARRFDEVLVMTDKFADEHSSRLIKNMPQTQELLVLCEHRGKENHQSWIRTARMNPQLNVVCVPEWDKADTVSLIRANHRGNEETQPAPLLEW